MSYVQSKKFDATWLLNSQLPPSTDQHNWHLMQYKMKSLCKESNQDEDLELHFKKSLIPAFLIIISMLAWKANIDIQPVYQEDKAVT